MTLTQVDLRAPGSSPSSEETGHYLFLLRDLTWRVLQGAEDRIRLKKRFGQLLRQGYPADLQLPYAYLVLLAHLLQLPPLPIHPRQMPNGSTCLDVGGFHPASQVPEPTQMAELGSLWMILGSRLQNDALLYAGLKLAVWQIHTLDHQGTSHFSLWARATSFHATQLFAYHDLLFSLAYKITFEKGFQRAALLQQKKARDPVSLEAQLLNLVPERKELPLKLSYRPLAEEITVGLMKFTTPEWSMACSLSGWNSGLFSYHKNGVAILNCGPQVAPFDALETFGIERACQVNGRRFEETVWEKTAYHFRLKGWTKVFARPLWMQADCFFQAKKLTLTTFFQENRPRDNLALAFYCQGERITVGGKVTLQAGSLERYQGKSLPLELCSKNGTIFLEPRVDQEMEIIPLAGGSHFWGAQFLVTFGVDFDKNEFQYAIK